MPRSRVRSAAAADRRLQPPDAHVLEERNRRSRSGQPAEDAENVLDLRHGKVVHRQPRQDDVVGGFGRQVLDRAVQHATALGRRLELGIGAKAVVEAIDEALVQFDQIEAIGRLHDADQVPGNGAGSGPDLQDPPRPVVG